MNYDPIPECVCGGTCRVPFSEEYPLSMIPCGACIARYDANHCYYCDKRHKGKTYPVPNNGQRCCAECAPKSMASFVDSLNSLRRTLEAQEARLRELAEFAPEVD